MIYWIIWTALQHLRVALIAQFLIFYLSHPLNKVSSFSDANKTVLGKMLRNSCSKFKIKLNRVRSKWHLPFSKRQKILMAP